MADDDDDDDGSMLRYRMVLFRHSNYDRQRAKWVEEEFNMKKYKIQQKIEFHKQQKKCWTNYEQMGLMKIYENARL
jgi:hypothetical protein